MTRSFAFDNDKYEKLLKAVTAMSLLFSDGPNAFIHYRFVEKLFVRSTGGRDISRSDKAFDAIVGSSSKIGVGVKTFAIRAGSKSQFEKVQEMTRYAGGGAFVGVSKEEVAHLAAEYRNGTVVADAKEFDLDLSKSIYHCLIRSGNTAFIHEEPYPLIDVDRIKPVDQSGNEIRKFPEEGSQIRFSDGTNTYSFSRSKSVLLKKFELSTHINYPPIPISLNEAIWNELTSSREELISKTLESSISELGDPRNNLEPGSDFVVLPLYSMKKDGPFVEVASGINQWNAAGRPRKYGESYIPIPQKVHKLAPGFFPHRDTPFSLLLPDSKGMVQAKVCQDNSKALMSNPNDLLCRWLYKVIDPNFSEQDFDKPPSRSPFTYNDLEKVGRDSVRVERKQGDGKSHYEITFAPLGAYEDFLSSLEPED